MSPSEHESKKGAVRPEGALAAVVARFLRGKNSILLLATALALGFAAVRITPREEEPQIVVPLADIFVEVPGASAEEIERLVATPLERRLWQLDGVEYVYSMSMRDRAIVTVRFFVGENREDSLVKLKNSVDSGLDELPPIVRSWLVKPIEIDDVPIVMLALYGEGYDDHDLRRIGEEVKGRLDTLENISRTALVGGRQRVLRVETDRERLAAHGLTLSDLDRALSLADAPSTLGGFDRLNRHIEVGADSPIRSAEELSDLVVASTGNRPVRLRDVASVADGPEEVSTYSRIVFGSAASEEKRGKSFPSVTLAVSKKKGTNATVIAKDIHARVQEIQRDILPEGIELLVTRDYGATADRKVDDLLNSIAFALMSVAALLFVFLGWREALVVTIAVPVSFSLALFVNLVSGYTINRVTLFALILSLGLVVDDPITNVDNIQRHIRMRKKRPMFATLDAVREVLPPVIMSTLTIIVSFLPMFFITGMMGPYMQPMAVNVPLAVTFSTLAALTVVPWLAYQLLKGRRWKTENESGDGKSREGWLQRRYRATVEPLLRRKRNRRLLILGVVALLGGSLALPALGLVPLKMLPFDNKNELQVMVDMPEGTTLEHTDRVVREFETLLSRSAQVVDLESFVGTASPIDFNGLVRHTYLRRAPHLADIRVTLVDRDERNNQSHAIALSMRDTLEELARSHGATMQLVEVPPGPPVLSTVVVEVRGSEEKLYSELTASAHHVARLMRAERGVTDVDVLAPQEHIRVEFVPDRDKAALHGVSAREVAHELRLALAGSEPATVRAAGERQVLPIRLRYPRAQRSGAWELSRVRVRGLDGRLVELSELGVFEERKDDNVIFHKNLERVVYVIGETAGRAPPEAILSMQSALAEDPLPPGIQADWAGEGEWEITLRVFRDLGLAFGAAMLFIYMLLVIETNSFLMPLVVMLAIPLTAIGIMPGFWMLNLFAGEAGGYPDPIFFTATAMIGMIALGGIVVRNSIVLIEYIKGRLAEGRDLKEAILQSGAVRMRPILLTAATTAIGAWPITLDPIFSGLAWALIFGLVASTGFTLVVVPVVYYALYAQRNT